MLFEQQGKVILQEFEVSCLYGITVSHCVDLLQIKSISMWHAHSSHDRLIKLLVFVQGPAGALSNHAPKGDFAIKEHVRAVQLSKTWCRAVDSCKVDP